MCFESQYAMTSITQLAGQLEASQMLHMKHKAEQFKSKMLDSKYTDKYNFLICFIHMIAQVLAVTQISGKHLKPWHTKHIPTISMIIYD